jgi:D-glycero-alpha-D-manno-heptose-7-phosphate kinase
LSPLVETPRIAVLMAAGRRAGALGGKVCGAGGGGFLLLYCEEPFQARVRTALAGLKETPFLFEPQGSKIIYVSD